MRQLIDVIWNELCDQANLLAQKALLFSPPVTYVLYEDSEKLFKENFEFYHKKVTEEYMASTEDLDRHKIAAITICAILNANVLGISQKDTDGEFGAKNILVNENIALSIALSYMLSELSDLVKNEKISAEYNFPQYVFPKPLSCERSFEEVWCRDLYFAKRDFKLNPLDISKDLFVIEEYSKLYYQLQNIKNTM